jgi:hypothetical protein
MRFSIRGLMIAVVGAAGLLALPAGWREIAATLALVCMVVFAAFWIHDKGKRHLARLSFWSIAILANVLFAAACTFPDGLRSILLCVIWFFFVLPSLGAFGYIWASLLSLEGSAGRRREAAAWACVWALTAMPLVTAVTLWPFRLTFLTAQPALGRLADRVAARQAVTYPVRVGPFEIIASSVDAQTGNVALMTDPDPSGPTAFIRQGARPRSGLYACYTPVLGDFLDVWLGGGWCFHQED